MPGSVVIASGDGAHLVDALVAGPLAGVEGAPILLALVDRLPEATANEIRRLGATTAYVIGTADVLGPAVEDGLRAAGITTIHRLGGADRFDTAVVVSEWIYPTSFHLTADMAEAFGPTDKPGKRKITATITERSVMGRDVVVTVGHVNVPGAPTGVTATGGNASATVSWTPPSSTGGYPVTNYVVRASSGATQTVGAVTSMTFAGLTNGTSYTFTVAAVNSAGTGPWSTASNAVTPAATVVPPGAPTNVQATPGNAQATITWTAPASNGGSAITGYTVRASTGATMSVGNVTSAVFTGLANGTAYTFTVAASNVAGMGAYSTASNSVTPQVSTALRVAHLSDLQLGTWDASWDTNMLSRLNALNPDYLLVVGDVANEGSSSQYTTYGNNMAAWKAKTIHCPGNHDYTPGNLNAYWAYFGTGTMSAGTPATATAPWYSIDLPNGWHVVSIAAAASQSGSPAVSSGSTQYNWLAADLTANESKPTLVIWHQPRWSTDNLHGDSTTPSALWDLCVTHRVDIVANGHVHLAQRFPRANSNSTLNSLAPMEFTGDADYHDRTVGSSALTPSFASNTQSFLVFTLDVDHFDWQFVAVDSGAILDSGTSPILPQSTATVPGAPTAVTATAGDTQATVSWTAPSSNGGSMITGYVVRASSGATQTVGNVTSMTFPGLTNGTAYTFTVAATNAIGTGSYSSASNSVTPQGSSATAPSAPTIGTAYPGDAQATVTWTAPSSDGGSAITSYTVRASNGTTRSVTAPATSTIFTGLTNGTSYTFTVAATNAVGTSPYSASSNAVTPVVPPTQTFYRLFTDTSLWNTIKGAPTTGYCTTADAKIQAATFGINNAAYSHPFFISLASDPEYTILCAYDPNRASWGWPLQVTLRCRIPVTANPPSGTDGPLNILLTQGGTSSVPFGTADFPTTTVPPNTLLDMYRCTIDHTTRTGQCLVYGVSPGLAGTGFGNPVNDRSAGTTAIGSCQVGGTITHFDIENGSIPHALCMAGDPLSYGGYFLGGGCSGGGEVLPAIHHDISNTDPGPIPEGGFLIIPPGTTKPGTLSTWGSRLWDAAATYGVYITDKLSGNPRFYGDGTSTVGNAFTSSDYTTVGRALRLVVTW